MVPTDERPSFAEVDFSLKNLFCCPACTDKCQTKSNFVFNKFKEKV